MYFNDVHILYYVLFILVGGIIGQFIDYTSKCFIKERKRRENNRKWNYFNEW